MSDLETYAQNFHKAVYSYIANPGRELGSVTDLLPRSPAEAEALVKPNNKGHNFLQNAFYIAVDTPKAGNRRDRSGRASEVLDCYLKYIRPKLSIERQRELLLGENNLLLTACRSGHLKLTEETFRVYEKAKMGGVITDSEFLSLFTTNNEHGYNLLLEGCASKSAQCLQFINDKYVSAVQRKALSSQDYIQALVGTERDPVKIFNDISACRSDEFLLSTLLVFKDHARDKYRAALEGFSEGHYPMLARALLSKNSELVARVCNDMRAYCKPAQIKQVLEYKIAACGRNLMHLFAEAGQKLDNAESALLDLFTRAYGGENAADVVLQRLNNERDLADRTPNDILNPGRAQSRY